MPELYARIDVNFSKGTKRESGGLAPSGNRSRLTGISKKQSGGSSSNGILSGSTKALAFVGASAAFANQAVGAYTGNKVRQQNISQGLKIAGSVGGLIGIGIRTGNPYIVAATAIIAATKVGVDTAIRITNANQEAKFRRSYMGNITSSGSRWRS